MVYVVSIGWGCQMWGEDQMEGGGAGGEIIHLRWNKGDGSLLNASQRAPGRPAEERLSARNTGWRLFLKVADEEV